MDSADVISANSSRLSAMGTSEVSKLGSGSARESAALAQSLHLLHTMFDLEFSKYVIDLVDWDLPAPAFPNLTPRLGN